jgi:hypothetical protein
MSNVPLESSHKGGVLYAHKVLQVFSLIPITGKMASPLNLYGNKENSLEAKMMNCLTKLIKRSRLYEEGLERGFLVSSLTSDRSTWLQNKVRSFPQ